MKRELDPVDERLWATVAATVRPLPGRSRPPPPPPPKAPADPPPLSTTPIAASPPVRSKPRKPQDIEPRRHHRLAAEREPLGGRLDLHGLDQDKARAALTSFIVRGHAIGRRTILVITGKGALGNGVLRRRVPEWLAEPPLRELVAGLSEAHRRHGGEGALYVALRRQRGP